MPSFSTPVAHREQPLAQLRAEEMVFQHHFAAAEADHVSIHGRKGGVGVGYIVAHQLQALVVHAGAAIVDLGVEIVAMGADDLAAVGEVAHAGARAQVVYVVGNGVVVLAVYVVS